jgi:hypothetical protein
MQRQQTGGGFNVYLQSVFLDMSFRRDYYQKYGCKRQFLRLKYRTDGFRFSTINRRPFFKFYNKNILRQTLDFHACI